MSGAPPGAEKCEPNLTPLLDLVLQLVMFFMLCANFDQLQKNKKVVLPKASQATAPDRTISVQLLVELAGPPKPGESADPSLPAGRGKWTISTGSGPQPLQGPTELFQKLQVEAKTYGVGKFADPNAPANKRKTKVAVILRIDENVSFKHMNEVMTEVSRAGFEEVQMRAIKE